MLLVAAIARRAIVTLGLGIGLTYGFLWLETNFRNHPLPFMKYIYTYQIGQIWFCRRGFWTGAILGRYDHYLSCGIGGSSLSF